MTASTRVRLRVSPGAGRAQIVGRHGDAWKVRVTAAPEQGRANDAVLRLLADALSFRARRSRSFRATVARDKIVELTGLGPDSDRAAPRRIGGRKGRQT